MNKFVFLTIFIFSSFSTIADDAILKAYEAEAKKIDIKFQGFNASSGEKLFRMQRLHSSGEKVSCMTCHTDNPKAEGLTRANKVIEPIAPVANKERFTDMAKVEKWFKRNCNDVLERPCTNLEKGDFIKFMMSVK